MDRVDFRAPHEEVQRLKEMADGTTASSVLRALIQLAWRDTDIRRQALELATDGTVPAPKINADAARIAALADIPPPVHTDPVPDDVVHTEDVHTDATEEADVCTHPKAQRQQHGWGTTCGNCGAINPPYTAT